MQAWQSALREDVEAADIHDLKRAAGLNERDMFCLWLECCGMHTVRQRSFNTSLSQFADVYFLSATG